MPRMLISMLPAGARAAGAGVGAAGRGGPEAGFGSTTVTGNSTGPRGSSTAADAAACRCSRRQLNSRLALTPASWAMAATEAPGTRLRSTSTRLNASLCLRRMSLGFVTRSPSMMCICWLRAHLQAGHESTDRAHCRTEGQCGLQTTLTLRWGSRAAHRVPSRRVALRTHGASECGAPRGNVWSTPAWSRLERFTLRHDRVRRRTRRWSDAMAFVDHRRGARRAATPGDARARADSNSRRPHLAMACSLRSAAPRRGLLRFASAPSGRDQTPRKRCATSSCAASCAGVPCHTTRPFSMM